MWTNAVTLFVMSMLSVRILPVLMFVLAKPDLLETEKPVQVTIGEFIFC